MCRNHIIRVWVVLVAALGALLGVVPAAQAGPQTTGPATAGRAGTLDPAAESGRTLPDPVRPVNGPESGKPLTGQRPEQPAEVRLPRTGEVGLGELSRTLPDPSGAKVFQGRALDTCQAPSAEAMRAWRTSSPYRGVGVYIGGRGRACPDQPHLTRGWMREVDDSGWSVLPIYVGSQSPCVRSENKRHVRMESSDGWGQGVREAEDAVNRARGLGIAKDSPVYLDMEAYDRSDRDCADTTLSFVKGWSERVRQLGYLAGYYSSADSGIAHLASARRAGHQGLPDVVWFARWKGTPSVDAEPVLGREDWKPHRRVHQYEGNVVRRYGGYRMQIDSNQVDAPVARVN
ncbi:glycoside hydrolase domain-containing protein [Streptomyces sp. NPDC005438]|uniref:glycoside hydrolase domain-containing protein n=1 Tax=Streptomyces sp. NPDC005438 TaxID=3156880 RepID=UPI0033AB83AB